MSLTGLAWLFLFAVLSIATFRRSTYGFALYAMTFYAPPTLWWWGEGVLSGIGERWALASALIFLAGLFFDGRPRNNGAAPATRQVGLLLLLYIVNAFCVHSLFAKMPENSWEFFVRICKYSLFSWMTHRSIRDAKDLKIVLYSLVMGGIYIGFEVYFNEAGRMKQGRLEGIPLGSASDANYLSSVLSMSLIVAGFLILTTKGWKRYGLVFGSALMLETIQQSLSRGTMLALGGATVVILTYAGKRQRKLAFMGVGLGFAAALLVMGQEDREQFVERFNSIFVSSEERDASAQSRTQLWGRCMQLIADNPAGLGGEAAFKSSYASRYVSDLDLDGKAVHNGYLDIAASWGVQGISIALLMLSLCARQLILDIRVLKHLKETNGAFLGAVWLSVGTLLAIAAVFISSLRGEWFYWWGAVALSYRQWLPIAMSRDAGGDESDDE